MFPDQIMSFFFFFCIIFQVSLHGGQVRSWKNERNEELLFTSNKVLM